MSCLLMKYFPVRSIAAIAKSSEPWFIEDLQSVESLKVF